MIFITVGTQAPFDRLVKTVDAVAGIFSTEEFIVQALDGYYKPKNLSVHNFLDPEEFDALFTKADLVISHAGIGTIVSALTKGKALIMMPRQSKFGEHRNDHQIVTAAKFQQLEYVHVVQNEEELSTALTAMVENKNFQVLHQTGDWASIELIDALKKDLYNFSLRKKKSS